MQAPHSTSQFTRRLSSWRSPTIRDLAWCIGSPPLVSMQNDENIWPDSDWYLRQLAGFEAHLQTLDAGQDRTRQVFAGARDKRLGAWFEFLLAQWLERDERYSLLARNVAVRKALKSGGRETLGELDFVIRDHKQKLTEHWEVAVKFYLGRPGSESAEAWFGPGLKDRLDLKLARICEHQLPLVRRPRTVEVLREKGLKVDRSRVLIKGRLFYPMAPEMDPPSVAAGSHLRGWWMRAREFPGPFAEHGWRWRCLKRGEWLAPVQHNESGDSAMLNADAFAASADIREATWPRMVVAVCDGVEVSRGFLVQDGWGHQQGEDRCVQKDVQQ